MANTRKKHGVAIRLAKIARRWVTMSDDERRERRTQWERRFNSVMVSIGTAGIIWLVSTVAKIDKSQATTAVRLDAIEVSAAGAYHASDAKRDVREMTDRLQYVEQRAAAIEIRVDRLEASAAAGGKR